MTNPSLSLLKNWDDQGQAARPSGIGRRRWPALLLLVLLLVLLLSPAPLRSAEEIVFPADGVRVNVKEAGAKGDGVTDDTAALNAAFAQGCGEMGVIYVPAGT